MINNIELEKQMKVKLQHLSINKEATLNVLMISGANYVLKNNIPTKKAPKGIKYSTYTINIDTTLKKTIHNYVGEQNILLRDFWNTVGETILEKNGDFDD